MEHRLSPRLQGLDPFVVIASCLCTSSASVQSRIGLHAAGTDCALRLSIRPLAGPVTVTVSYDLRTVLYCFNTARLACSDTCTLGFSFLF